MTTSYSGLPFASISHSQIERDNSSQFYPVVMTINILCIQILRWVTQEAHEENDISAFSPALTQCAGNNRRNIPTKRLPLENWFTEKVNQSSQLQTRRQLYTHVLPHSALITVTLFFNFMSCFGQNMHLYFHGFTEIQECIVYVSGTLTFKGTITPQFSEKVLKYHLRVVESLGTNCCPLQTLVPRAAAQSSWSAGPRAHLNHIEIRDMMRAIGTF